MLTLIPTPIGNLKDISLNVIEKLKNTEIFICEDTRVTKKLLNLLNEKLSLNIEYKNKIFVSYHSHTSQDKFNEIIKYLDKDCVYLSDAGMPCVSDPGSKLIEYCINNNIQYEAYPGANAALLAYSLSGFEFKEFLFYGFLPHKKDRVAQLTKILNNNYLTILYEAPTRIKQLLQEINLLDPNRIIFIAKELTKLNQLYIKDTVSHILTKQIDFRGEWVVIISPKKNDEKTLSYNDIISLDIPPKIKAKLLSKITGENVKNIYEKLVS
jgi:16S rRNA (cytidine1402-2'-O)-methyltransferase